MNKNYDFHVTQQAIDVLMKFAAVIITSVATLSVAREAFAHVSEPWITVIEIGALILIEGAFIVSWLAIDTQHHAPMQMKIAWAVTLVVIYIALLVIALEHGEGSAGWAFRFVLAVMIGRSIFESGVYESLRGAHRADRDIRSLRSVRRIQRRLAKQNAIRSMTMESTESNYARELDDVVSRARIEAEHEAAILDVNKMRGRLLDQVKAKDSVARRKLLATYGEERKPPSNEGARRLIIRPENDPTDR